jgi:hypothetical protein
MPLRHARTCRFPLSAPARAGTSISDCEHTNRSGPGGIAFPTLYLTNVLRAGICPNSARACRAPPEDGQRPSKERRTDQDVGAVVGRPGSITTAADEYNLVVRTVQKILAEAENSAKNLGLSRLTLTHRVWDELVGPVASTAGAGTRCLPEGLTGSGARRTWEALYDRCGGIAKVLELVLRHRQECPSGEDRRGYRLAVEPLAEGSAGARALQRHLQLHVALNDQDKELQVLYGLDPTGHPIIRNVSVGVKSPLASLIRMHAAEALRFIYGNRKMKTCNEYVAQFRLAVQEGGDGHMLFRICTELLGHSADYLSLSTTAGPHRGDYAQVVLLFHELLPRAQGKMFFQKQIGLFVVARRTPQDAQELMNLSRNAVSRSDTNVSVKKTAGGHAIMTALVLRANPNRWVLWCWDNYKEDWRSRSYGTARVVTAAGVTHCHVIDFAVKIAEIPNHRLPDSPPSDVPVTQPPEGFVGYVPGWDDSVYRQSFVSSVLGPTGLNIDSAVLAPTLMDRFVSSGDSTLEIFFENLADHFFESRPDQSRTSGDTRHANVHAIGALESVRALNRIFYLDHEHTLSSFFWAFPDYWHLTMNMFLGMLIGGTGENPSSPWWDALVSPFLQAGFFQGEEGKGFQRRHVKKDMDFNELYEIILILVVAYSDLRRSGDLVIDEEAYMSNPDLGALRDFLEEYALVPIMLLSIHKTGGSLSEIRARTLRALVGCTARTTRRTGCSFC